MSKIIYLLGAGASYGSREKETGKIERGVPVINEFVKCIGDTINTVNDDFIKRELSWLKEICEEYPTVDTYAKVLYAREGINGLEYKRLKKAISIFLSLIQTPNKRDPRYDLFLAALTQNGPSLPNNTSILSWNYDSQLEFAYSKYLPNIQNLNDLWQKLNVFNKTTHLKANNNAFGIIKLNGTALLKDTDNKSIVDIYLKSYPLMDIYTVLNTLYRFDSSNIELGLSFSWEKNDTLLEYTKKVVADAESLIVIGYSFPNVNRDVDRDIISRMENLKTIYIQDPNAKNIRGRIENVLTPVQTTVRKVQIKEINDVTEFFIPQQ